MDFHTQEIHEIKCPTNKNDSTVIYFTHQEHIHTDFIDDNAALHVADTHGLPLGFVMEYIDGKPADQDVQLRVRFLPDHDDVVTLGS